MVTIIAMVAERDGIDCTGLGYRVEKHMTKTPPRRIDALPVSITMPKGLSPEQKAKLERAALTCPVHHSLLPEIKKEVEFLYE